MFLNVNADGQWKDNNCGNWAKFICKKTVDDVPFVTHAPTTAPTGGCPTGWKKYNNRCYIIGGTAEGEQKNWQDARSACPTLNTAATFASLHDVDVQSNIIAFKHSSQNTTLDKQLMATKCFAFLVSGLFAMKRCPIAAKIGGLIGILLCF